MVTTRSTCWAGWVLPFVLSKFRYITHAAENAEMCASQAYFKELMVKSVMLVLEKLN